MTPWKAIRSAKSKAHVAGAACQFFWMFLKWNYF